MQSLATTMMLIVCAHRDGVADTVQYSRGNVFVDSFWKKRGDISSFVVGSMFI